MSHFTSINPANGETLASIPMWDINNIDHALEKVSHSYSDWSSASLTTRAELMKKLAASLREQREPLARLITLEMGKLITESRSEIDKCAAVCDYYAEQAALFLSDEHITTDAGKSFVAYQSLGTVLAIMPWNFPFWQVFRFAAPALMAGNCAVLKHASNVPQCAQAIETLFLDAGFPEHCFKTLMIPASLVAHVINSPHIHAITLTGSEAAGRAVAATAGQALKKCVLELGGSDAFIVLEDANLELAVSTAVTTRFLNAGQSCIAGKRFIVVDAIANEFVDRFKAAIEQLSIGDPLSEDTTLAPLARMDLRDELHQQVQQTLSEGAVALTGCHLVGDPEYDSGAYYPASLLDHLTPSMYAAREELFGPVAGILRVTNEQHAMQIANSSRFGLAGSIWTEDQERGEHLARQLESGAAFVNGLVKSDPRLPFGGIKDSGYGRELSHHGMHEFLNIKTIWIR